MPENNKDLHNEDEQFDDDMDDDLELDEEQEDDHENDEGEDDESQDNQGDDNDQDADDDDQDDSEDRDKQLSRRDVTRKKRWEESIKDDSINYEKVLDNAKDPFLMKYIERFAKSQGYEDSSELLQEAMEATNVGGSKKLSKKNEILDELWKEHQNKKKKDKKTSLSESRARAKDYVKTNITDLGIDAAEYNVTYKPLLQEKRREYILDGLDIEKATVLAFKDVKLKILEGGDTKETDVQMYSKSQSGSSESSNKRKTHRFTGAVKRNEFYSWDKERRMEYRKQFTKDDMIQFSG